MIFLEGADNSGKTTLAKKMSKLLDIPFILGSPHPPRDSSVLDEWYKNLVHYGGLAVYDRCPMISEMVYGHVLRGHDVQQAQEALERLCITHSPIFIYCRPSDSVLFDIKRLKFRPDETPEHIEEIKDKHFDIVKRYDSVMKTVSHFKYDYQENADLTEAILRAFVMWKKRYLTR